MTTGAKLSHVARIQKQVTAGTLSASLDKLRAITLEKAKNQRTLAGVNNKFLLPILSGAVNSETVKVDDAVVAKAQALQKDIAIKVTTLPLVTPTAISGTAKAEEVYGNFTTFFQAKAWQEKIDSILGSAVKALLYGLPSVAALAVSFFAPVSISSSIASWITLPVIFAFGAKSLLAIGIATLSTNIAAGLILGGLIHLGIRAKAKGYPAWQVWKGGSTQFHETISALQEAYENDRDSLAFALEKLYNQDKQKASSISALFGEQGTTILTDLITAVMIIKQVSALTASGDLNKTLVNLLSIGEVSEITGALEKLVEKISRQSPLTRIPARLIATLEKAQGSRVTIQPPPPPAGRTKGKRKGNRSMRSTHMQSPKKLIGGTGEYEIVGSAIGAGGMGSVYRAKQLTGSNKGRVVAVKVLSFEQVVKPLIDNGVPKEKIFPLVKGFLQRFEQEFRITRTLAHDNLCPAYDTNLYGLFPGIDRERDFVFDKVSQLNRARQSAIFFVSKFIPESPGSEKAAPSLAQVIKQTAVGGGVPTGLKLDDAIPLLTGCMPVFELLHRNSVFHRDIKPLNFLLTTDEDGSPFLVVIDLGIAKVTTRDDELTRTGVFAHSPIYFAPLPYEIKGRANAPEFAKTDIYQFALVAYEMITGKSLFRAMSDADRDSFYNNPQEHDLSALPEQLQPIFAKALHPDPNQCFTSMEEFRRSLEKGEIVVLSHSITPLPISYGNRVEAIVSKLTLNGPDTDYATMAAMLAGFFDEDELPEGTPNPYDFRGQNRVSVLTALGLLVESAKTIPNPESYTGNGTLLEDARYAQMQYTQRDS